MNESFFWMLAIMQKQQITENLNNMGLNRLLLFGLLMIIEFLNAQTDFRPGYIIENSGDTIHGEIDYRGDILMGNVCRFKDVNEKKMNILHTILSHIDLLTVNFMCQERLVLKKYF